VHSQDHALGFSLEDLFAQLLSILALEFSLECAANEVCGRRQEEFATLRIGTRTSERVLECGSVSVNLFRCAVLRKLRRALSYFVPQLDIALHPSFERIDRSLIRRRNDNRLSQRGILCLLSNSNTGCQDQYQH